MRSLVSRKIEEKCLGENMKVKQLERVYVI
jgi:hypothetical protein